MSDSDALWMDEKTFARCSFTGSYIVLPHPGVDINSDRHKWSQSGEAEFSWMEESEEFKEWRLKHYRSGLLHDDSKYNAAIDTDVVSLRHAHMHTRT